MTPLFSPLVERALRVAAKAHRGQNRKQTDLPYISHSVAVAMILQRAGFDDDAILAAAILHDVVVEDTPFSAEQLAAEFPPDVAEFVAVLSEKKLDDAGNKRSWHDRKRDHIAVVATAALAPRAIVLADKLHNLCCVLLDLENGEPVWDRFNAPRDEFLDYHRKMVAAAAGNDTQLDPLADECRLVLQQLASYPDVG